MTFRQKRSNGGYGLRRKVAKKRLDEDFEYYNFSKTASFAKSCQPQLSTKQHCRSNSNLQVPQISIVEMEMKGLTVKKQKGRGRPKKLQIEILKDNDSLKCLESSLKFVHLKGQQLNKPTILYIEPPNDSIYTPVEEVCGVDEQGTMSVSHEEVVDNTVDFGLMWKKIKVEALPEVNDNVLSGSEEEKGEKENLPDHRGDLVSDLEFEDGIIMELSVYDSHEGLSVDLNYDDDTTGTSKRGLKRKYRKKLEDQLIGLTDLSSDHKIECSECHKLLKPSSFRQHLRTHTGEKPFCCIICDARFTRKGDVERHVRIVHNKQKPFKCSRCQRAFGDKKNLRWHLMNHDKQLFYICETCGFKFGKREYWENHVRFIHPLPGGLDPSEVRVGCEEEESQQVNPTITESVSENNVTTDASSLQIVDTTILSIQDPVGSSDVIETFPDSYQIINQNTTKYVSVDAVDFCNLIKLQEFPTSGYQESERVVIEYDEVDPHLGMTTEQPYTHLTELVNSSTGNVLHIVHEQNTDEIQDLPIIIDRQDSEPGTLYADGEIGTSIIKSEIIEGGQVISGILLNGSELVASGGISNSSMTHSFINAFIDVAINANNVEGNLQAIGTDEILISREQC